MGRNPICTVYIGNLDEKVTDRILYEILIQVGHIVDLFMPQDKEANRHKGFAFAEFETEEVADYAVRLFSGNVRLYNKTLRFAISSQGKPSLSNDTPSTPRPNSHASVKPHPLHFRKTESLQDSLQSPTSLAGCIGNGADPCDFDYCRRFLGSIACMQCRMPGFSPSGCPSPSVRCLRTRWPRFTHGTSCSVHTLCVVNSDYLSLSTVECLFLFASG
ncbi:unnamed protein product [Spirodela intermedia]|uniref:RRM domain-containing protein n=2 Tax=Spirodela intermedia TaxID=51605 RepID=A0A7I8IQW6_SPIIN|nr:unnamed protein product [Spirodela intermedia]CAA6660193.1 unnamed protein product [Spirodela intermedia]CAA7396515.1 unnamed protein product [Spirodela intermedia]